MALSTTKISEKQVRDALGETTLSDVGLCSSTKINEWSPYKPINNSVVPRADATRDYISGFHIINNYLEYNRPTGGSSSPYCLGDFRGYNHYARRPSVQNESLVLLDNNAALLSAGPISVSINITNPDQVCFAKVLNENMPTLTPKISIYEVVNGVEGGMIKNNIDITNGIDGVTRVSFDIIFATVPTTGSTIVRTFNIWYGDAGQTRRFRIHGADVCTVTIKIISAYPKVAITWDPTDFFAIGGVTAANTVYNYDYNANTKTLIINSLQFSGPTKGPSTFVHTDGHTYSVDYRGLDSNTNTFSTQARYSYGPTGLAFDAMSNFPRGFVTSITGYDVGYTWTMTIGTPITLTNINRDDVVSIKLRRDPLATYSHLIAS